MVAALAEGVEAEKDNDEEEDEEEEEKEERLPVALGLEESVCG